LFGFNEFNGGLAADQKPSELVGDAAFVSGAHEVCGNTNSEVVEIKAKYNFDLPAKTEVDPQLRDLVPATQAGFLRFAVAMVLDTTPETNAAGKRLAPKFIGSSSVNPLTGQATVRVRKEKGKTLTLTPVVGDTCLFNANKCSFGNNSRSYRPLVPLDDFGAVPQQVTGSKDFGTLESEIALLPGTVVDKDGQAVAQANVSARLSRGEINASVVGAATNRPVLPLNIALTGADGKYAMFLPVNKTIPYVVAATRDNGMLGGIANGGQVDVTTQTPPSAPPIVVNNPTAAQPPTNPDTFKVEQQQLLKLKLTWSAATGATSYDILCRKLEEGENTFEPVVENLPASQLSYEKTLGEEYLGKGLVFRLVSRNANGSVFKDALIRLVDNRPIIRRLDAVQVSGPGIKLSWTIENFDSTKTLQLKRGGTVLTGVPNTAMGEFTDTAVTEGQRYTYTIVANNSTGERQDSIDITVTSASISVSINNNDPIKVGTSRTFTATVSGRTNTAVTWQVTPALTGLEMSTQATYLFGTAGTYTITATSVSLPKISASKTVDVGPIITGVSPNRATKGAVVTFTGLNLSAPPTVVTVDGLNATSVEVLSATSLRFTVPDCGCATKPAPIVVSNALGSSQAFNGFTYEASAANRIEITAPNTLLIEEPTTFTARVLDANNQVVPGETVTWSSSNTNLATVNNAGVVTAKRFGEMKITATLNSNSSIAADKTVKTYGLQMHVGTINRVDAAGSSSMSPRFGFWLYDSPVTAASVRSAKTSMIGANQLNTAVVAPQATATVQLTCSNGISNSFEMGINSEIAFSSSGVPFNGTCSAITTIGGKNYKSNTVTAVASGLISVPSVISVISASPTSVSLSWSGVSGATLYVYYVQKPGGNPIFPTTATNGVVSLSPPLSNGMHTACVDAHSIGGAVFSSPNNFFNDQVYVGSRCTAFTIGTIDSLKLSAGTSQIKFNTNPPSTKTLFSNLLSNTSSSSIGLEMQKKTSITPLSTLVGIAGPGAWGTDNVPLNVVAVADKAPISGTYTATYNDGTETYTASSTADASQILALPTSFNLDTTLTTQVGVSWSAVAGASHYQVVLLDATASTVLQQSSYLGSTAASHSLNSLSLATATPYNACIKAFSKQPVDNVGMGQINQSMWCKSFTIPAPITTVELAFPTSASDGKLKVGEPYTFTPRLLDDSGNPVSNTGFNWTFGGDTSEQTNNATAITITPKRFGNYTLRATLKSDSSKFKEINLGFYGLLVRGGTVNHIGGASNTRYLNAWFVTKDGTGGGTANIGLSCNSMGHPTSFNVTINGTAPYEAVHGGAATGCTATTTVSGVTYTAPFTINAASTHPATAMVSVNTSTITSTKATVSWDAVTGNALYSARMFNNSGTPVGSSDAATTTALVNVSPSLVSGAGYVACTYSFATNPYLNKQILIEQINYGKRCQSFTFVPVVATVRINRPMTLGNDFIKLGTSYTFTAEALDSENAVISGVNFTWSGSNSIADVVSGATTANVTAKRLDNNYNLVATAVGSGISGSRTLIPYGLMVSGGEYLEQDMAGSPIYSALFVGLLKTPGSTSTVSTSMTVSCTDTTTFSFSFAGINTSTPVPHYTNADFDSDDDSDMCTASTTVDGIAYSSSFAVADDEEIDLVDSIGINISSVPNSIVLGWDNVGGNAAFFNVVVDRTTPSPMSIASIDTLNTTTTINRPGQFTNGGYVACVTAYDRNPLLIASLPNQINASTKCTSFNIP
jgi:hypothetical protein